MTPEKQRIAIAEACGKQVLPVGGSTFPYANWDWLDTYIRGCRLAGKDINGDFWDRVKPDILDNIFPSELLSGRSSYNLQYLDKGWVHTYPYNPLGIWTLGGCSQAFDREPKLEEGRGGLNVQVWRAKDVPDYLNSLDAMHEAEKALSYEQHCFYCDILEMVVGGPAYMPAVRATAAQRAEAFLRTLNLWVED